MWQNLDVTSKMLAEFNSYYRVKTWPETILSLNSYSRVKV